MPDTSTHLGLPYLLAAQAQKHVTHNEALRLLDALVQLSVLDRTRTAPPASPADGDRHLVASGAIGLWAGWDLNVAFWVEGAWLRLVPRSGWLVWIAAEQAFVVWNGSAWEPVGAPQDVSDAEFSLFNDADPTKEGAVLAFGDQHRRHADLYAAEHLERVGDPRGHADLHRQQDVFRHADRVWHCDGLGGLRQHRHGDDDRDLRHGRRGHDHRRHKDREPWNRRRVGIDHRRQHRVRACGGRGHDGRKHADGHLRQRRHAGRHAAGQPDRSASGPRRATADSANRLSVNAPALLFNNAGAGIEATVNKAAPANDAAFAFKTGFSARALIGLLGNDDFSFKVSPDGSVFFEALRIDRTNGQVELPQPTILPGLSAAPSPPAAGKAAVYARNRAGAPWIDVMRPSGRDFPLQPHFGVNRIANWSPSVTTTITTEGLPITSVGTVSHPTLAATNLAASMRRWRLTSAAVVDSAAEQRSAGWACWRGNAAGLGGWTFVTRISLTTLQATGMGFFGLYGSTAALATTLTLATVVSCVGIGFQRGAHTRWQLVANDARAFSDQSGS